MRRSWLLRLGSLLSLGMFGFGAWVLLWPAAQVTEANFRRIQGGMTKAEVESFLGKPDDFEESIRTYKEMIIDHEENAAAGKTKSMIGVEAVQFPEGTVGSITELMWRHGDTHIYVSFSDDNKVVRAEFITIPHLTLTERIRSWLGL
jgi:hypothetical protein